MIVKHVRFLNDNKILDYQEHLCVVYSKDLDLFLILSFYLNYLFQMRELHKECQSLPPNSGVVYMIDLIILIF